MAEVVEKEQIADDEQYLVVVTTYPTTYGCNRGMRWTRADMIHRSEVDTTGPYDTYDDALESASEARADSVWFEGYEDEGHWEDDNLPWDSADAGNYDNDEEVMIEIMKKSDFEKQEAENEEFLDKARHQKIFEARVAEGVMAAQVKAAGRVFYSSFSPKPYDIPAELELGPCKKTKGGDTKEGSTGVEEAPLKIPDNIASVKTLLFRCGKE
jgi:hypothetical protein